MFTTNAHVSGKFTTKNSTGTESQEERNLELFEYDMNQLTTRNRSIVARNKEWQKICLMCGFEFKPMKLEG